MNSNQEIGESIMFNGNGTGRKEIRKFIKEVRNQVVELDYLSTKKHTKIFFSQKNHSGNIVKLPLIIVSSSPSKRTWKQMKISDINRLMREHNCPEIKRCCG